MKKLSLILFGMITAAAFILPAASLAQINIVNYWRKIDGALVPTNAELTLGSTSSPISTIFVSNVFSTTTTFTGTSTFEEFNADNATMTNLAVTLQARFTGGTTSASNGVNLSAGCFAINGTCVGQGGITSLNGLSGSSQTLSGGQFVTVTSAGTDHLFRWTGTTSAQTWSALQTFSSGLISLSSSTIQSLLSTNATTSVLHVSGNLTTGTATSTFGGPLTVGGSGTSTFATGGIDLTGGGCFAIGGTCLTGGGSQTPWTSNIDGGGFSLQNVGSLTATSASLGTLTTSDSATINGTTTAFSFSATSTELLWATDTPALTINGTSMFLGLFSGEKKTGLSSNVGVGYEALRNVNSGGTENIAIGFQALTALTTGDRNTVIGYTALEDLVTSFDNTVVGHNAANDITTGSDNSVFGSSAFGSASSGSGNSAFGSLALFLSTSAIDNSAFGMEVMDSTTSGGSNSAFGREALDDNTTGSDNSAFGKFAGRSNTTGKNNVFIGRNSGYQGLVIGDGSTPATLNNAIAIGAYAQVTRSNALVLGGFGHMNVDVAIGTTSPWAKLSIQNQFGSTTPLFDIATTTDSANATTSILEVLGSGNVTIGALGTTTIGNDLYFSGSSKVFYVKVGTNQTFGTTTLSSGTATVSNTLIRADSLVQLTHCVVGGTLGILSVGTRVSGTSFVVDSTNVLDTSEVCYEIKNPIY